MATTNKSVDTALKEFGRGLAGGLLFSLPMLYTAEFWIAGFLTSPSNLLIYLIVGIFLLLVYNRYVGLSSDHNLFACFMEALEELGLGIVVTLIILYFVGRITPDMSYSEVIGKIVVNSITVAIGIAIGKSQLGDNPESDEEGEEEKDEDEEGEEEKAPPQLDESDPKSRIRYVMRSINLALCGSLVVAANIAPTDEVYTIALETDPFKILLIAIVSLIIGSAILYHINFHGSKEKKIHRETFWEMAAESFTMYTLALLISAFMLWFFGRFDGLSIYLITAQTVVLGFPAALGASAGRFLIQ